MHLQQLIFLTGMLYMIVQKLKPKLLLPIHRVRLFCLRDLQVWVTVLEPITKTPIINAKVIPTETPTSGIDKPPVELTDCNIASIEITIMSSIIATPRIRIEDSSFIIPSSSNTLMTITVLVTEMMVNARNRLSKNEKFSAEIPTKKPMEKVPRASDNAITNAFLPIFLNFSIGNSIPTTNNKSTIPISANRFSTSRFNIKLNGGV